MIAKSRTGVQAHERHPKPAGNAPPEDSSKRLDVRGKHQDAVTLTPAAIGRRLLFYAPIASQARRHRILELAANALVVHVLQ